jgi:DNA-binding transcriptional regulator YhcF (GntR family)
MDPILPLAIDLPPRGSRDLLRALHRQLRTAILDGRLQPGLRLPATRALAAGLGVSRNTTVPAYDLLLSESEHMDDIISKLTAQQGLMIVERLARKGGKLREAVVAEAMNILTEIDLDETADQVFDALDSIDIQDCWDRSGGSRDGYTSPEEAAAEIIDEELQPFIDQVERYCELEMPAQETAYCMAVVFGLYRYDQESKSEFRELSEDVPGECAGLLLDKWRERNPDKGRLDAMREFIRERCPEWPRLLKGRS